MMEVIGAQDHSFPSKSSLRPLHRLVMLYKDDLDTFYIHWIDNHQCITWTVEQQQWVIEFYPFKKKRKEIKIVTHTNLPHKQLMWVRETYYGPN